MRPLHFFTWISSGSLFCIKSTGKNELAGCLLSLKDGGGLSELRGAMTMDRMSPFHLGVCLQVITATLWAGSTQGEKKREKCPINSMQWKSSPQWKPLSGSNEATHFYAYASASTYNAKGQSTVFIHTDMTCPNHCHSQKNTMHNCTPEKQPPSKGKKKNSIAFTWLNKPTKARKFKVKFYTPSLVPHYCEREIKGTMACVRGAMSAVTALPGFY